MDALGLGILLALFFTHFWMMLFAKSRLDLKRGDKSFDFSGHELREKLGMALGLVGLAVLFWIEAIQLTEGNHLGLNYLPYGLGVIFYSLGFALRLWSIRTLGRLFTFEIGIRTGHSLIQEGPYRWFRHPSYSGYFGMALGMALIVGHDQLWIALLILFPVNLFFMIRVPSEEKMLTQHFGTAYQSYAQERWGVLPLRLHTWLRLWKHIIN